MTQQHRHARVTARALAIAPTELFVDGAWRPAADGATLDVANPATGAVLATIAAAGPDDARAALDAAASARDDWARTPARTRSELLRAAFERVHELGEEFASLMTLEMGKPLTDARAEVTYGAEFLRWYAEEAVRINGRYAASPEGNLRLLTVRRPVGPCLFITPWNFPLAMATRKIAPALAAGCTVVLKPAALTPLTSLALARVLEEVGVPAGVVNVVPTASAGAVTDPLLADRRLRKLSFTGSTAVGRSLLRTSADNVLRTSMELGGCAPFIVFEDADLDLAVEHAVRTKMRNIGQACNAANSFHVQRGVVEAFTDRLTERLGSLPIGNGLDAGVEVGPLVSEGARADVDTLVRDAVAAGARVATGGAVPEGPGSFYPPTVLADVPADAAILGREIFGPVAPVTSFDTEEEVLARANASEVGLAGYLHTGDMARVLRFAERLEVGLLGVNSPAISNAAAPFGGVKHSGLGREGGPEGIEEYLETVYVGLTDPFA